MTNKVTRAAVVTPVRHGGQAQFVQTQVSDFRSLSQLICGGMPPWSQ